MSNSKTIRLNKRLVQLGLAPSRRKADELITGGEVIVDGNITTTLGTMVDDTTAISVGGKKGTERANIYLAYNKPVGEVCSHVSQAGAKTIFESLPKAFGALKIAGRLDQDSQGLLILSSDGDFVQQLSHPGVEKEKEYIVTTFRALSNEAQKSLAEGVKLDDGLSAVRKLRVMPAKRTALVLTEGRNRQIRRMFKAVGYEVTKLERIRVGNYRNDQLLPREYVFIQPKDVL